VNTGVSINRIFIVFAIVVGVATGAVIVLVPQSRTIGLAPYFWVLIAFALFEGIVHWRRGMAAGPPITMPARLIGFAIALALMVLIPMAAGIELKIF
jgi:hypothetical protein